jgi:hypothetical protein
LNFDDAFTFFFSLTFQPSSKKLFISIFFCQGCTAVKSLHKKALKIFLNSEHIFFPFRSFRKSRSGASVTCNDENIVQCHPLENPCLFDVINDACEKHNLAEKFPNILKTMLQRLKEFNVTAIPPANKPIDERANPIYFDRTWTNFGDFIAGIE